ncbi:MAG TPA: prepilin-type N-terminal cleavage/methylation domain-containing protein [Solirubrobacteraceae bacterium]|jgi:prepilin-type N-terminal cleavage/methylation domain-containing protein|nr:prepilin-type N-terminal cleavage/methylation domain-containing protein [Solirubrobacteraceae bacterium]
MRPPRTHPPRGLADLRSTGQWGVARSARTTAQAPRGERGYTLIELLVSMAIGTILLLGALAFLQFATSDVARIAARAQVDRTGRTALEKIMLALHSACVAPLVIPIQPGSTGTTIKFISETSPLNTNGEPVSALQTVRLHEITYTPASGKAQGTLTERSWPGSGTASKYIFNTAAMPTTRKLLTGVTETVGTGESGKHESLPIFRYYRYYKEGDTKAAFGVLNPNRTTALEEKETEDIAKVTVSFTLAPEGHQYTTLGNDRPVALEDSAVFRLETSSEAAGTSNLPCTRRA